MIHELLTDRIKAYLAASGTTVPFRPATEDAIVRAEEELGFQIPGILRSCYLRIGNGGFGPGYGLIGVAGGYASDCGDLVQAYKLFQESEESEGKKWPHGMLPFCEWGCNIYTCVDCLDPSEKTYKYTETSFTHNTFMLYEFFDLWMRGANILSHSAEPQTSERRSINNPFRK